MTVEQDDLLLLDKQICFPLYAAANLLTRRYRPLLEPLGLTYPQYLVMMVLWETEPVQMADLGARLFLDSGTLTPLLKRMETAGFITRVRDKSDERRMVIALTAAGRRLKKKAAAVPQALIAQSQVPACEAEALRETLHQLVVALAAEDPG